jgi:hypothetical protein
VLLPYDATDGLMVAQLNVYRDVARRLGVTLVEKAVRTQEEAEAAITGARRGAVDGIFSPRFVCSASYTATSPSRVKVAGLSAARALTSSGNRLVWSRPLRLTSRTELSALVATIRQPSTFSS